MRKLDLFNLGLLFIALVVIVACSQEMEQSNSNIFNKEYDPELRIELGKEVYASFYGQILDEMLHPVEGALISVGESEVYTDKDGFFRLDKAQVNEYYALLTVEKLGYFKGYRNVIPKLKRSSEIKIMMQEKVKVGSIVAETGGQVYIEGQDHSVSFQPGFVDEWNNEYEGIVQVYAKYIDPHGEYIDLLMPGSLDRAVTRDNEEVALISYGMLNVELYGSEGERLQLAEGSFAELSIKAPESRFKSIGHPEDVPIWYLDDMKGYWIEYGMATLINGQYVGKVPHFTPTNVDEPIMADPPQEEIE